MSCPERYSLGQPLSLDATYDGADDGTRLSFSLDTGAEYFRYYPVGGASTFDGEATWVMNTKDIDYSVNLYSLLSYRVGSTAIMRVTAGDEAASCEFHVDAPEMSLEIANPTQEWWESNPITVSVSPDIVYGVWIRVVYRQVGQTTWRQLVGWRKAWTLDEPWVIDPGLRGGDIEIALQSQMTMPRTEYLTGIALREDSLQTVDLLDPSFAFAVPEDPFVGGIYPDWGIELRTSDGSRKIVPVSGAAMSCSLSIGDVSTSRGGLVRSGCWFDSSSSPSVPWSGMDGGATDLIARVYGMSGTSTFEAKRRIVVAEFPWDFDYYRDRDRVDVTVRLPGDIAGLRLTLSQKFDESSAWVRRDLFDITSSDPQTVVLHDVHDGVGGEYRLSLVSSSGATGVAGPEWVAYPSSSITGRIVVPNDAHLDGVVVAYKPRSLEVEEVVDVGADGSFRIPLLPGKHFLRFFDFDGAANEWYDNSKTLAGAVTVTPRFGEGRNIGTVVLAPSGSIGGEIASPPGYSAGDVCVYAYHKNGSYEMGACGLPGSPFTLDNLSTDGYKLVFVDEDDNFQYWRGSDSWRQAAIVTVVAGSSAWLQTGPVTIDMPTDFVSGEATGVVIDTGNDAVGSAKMQQKKPGGSWTTVSGAVKVVDGLGAKTVTPTKGIQYRVVFGGVTSNVVAPTLVNVSSVELTVPSSYVAGVPFDVDVALDEPGNGTAKLQQRIDGGAWKTVKHGVKIVDGAGSRTITLNGGDTVEYRASYYGSDLSDVVSLTRDEITFDAAGGGDFFKGGAYDVDFTVTSDETFAGDVDLWVKKGSKKWTKAGKVTFVDGAGTATVKPSAKTTLYQLRAGPDRSAVVTFTKVNPTITLAFGDGDDGTHVVGDSFDLNVAIAGPDASTVPLYTGNVVLKIRKPGKSWKKVSGGVNIVDGVGTITLNQLKGKRDYQVVFGGKKSHIVRATGTAT